MIANLSRRPAVRCVTWFWAPVVAALGAAGCGKEAPPPIVPVAGVVTLNGAPLPKAQIRFIPNIAFGANVIATATTDDAGRFVLKCDGQSGACTGEHLVTVAEGDLPPELQGENAQAQAAAYLRGLKNRPIPELYATPVRSPLKVTVTAGQTEYNLELRR